MIRRGFPAALVMLCLVWPALASTAGAQTHSTINGPEIGAEFNDLHFSSEGSTGFDANLWTNPIGGPISALRIHTSIAIEGGWHPLVGSPLTTVTGGVHLTADGLGSDRLHPYGDVLFGVGHFSVSPENGVPGPSETDKVLVLMVGVEVPVRHRLPRLRLEIGPLVDFFDGGHQLAWRYSVGLGIPLK